MEDIKLFAKNEKELEILTKTIRIYSQDIRMEFVRKKCARLLRKSGKKETMEEVKPLNQERIKSLEKRKAASTCEY